MELNGFDTPAIDVLDLAYQADPAFKPDKEALWKHEPNQDGWYLAHNAIRHELRGFRDALDAVGDVPLEEWQVKAMSAWWTGHAAHVHAHHSNEDDIFNPFMRTRVVYPEKLETDHVGLVEQMETIASLINGLAAGGSAAELRSAWGVYVALMEPHLYEEEVVGIPLMRAYFAPNEVAPIVQKILKACTKLETGSFIHAMGGKKEAKRFMSQEHIPGFVWHVAFKPSRTAYRKQMQSLVDSLCEGRPLVRVSRTKAQKASFAPADSENALGANGLSRAKDGDVASAPRSPLGVKHQLLPVEVRSEAH